MVYEGDEITCEGRTSTLFIKLRRQMSEAHLCVAEVLQQDGHDLVAEGGDDLAEGSADVADEADGSMTHLQEKIGNS